MTIQKYSTVLYFQSWQLERHATYDLIHRYYSTAWLYTIVLTLFNRLYAAFYSFSVASISVCRDCSPIIRYIAIYTVSQKVDHKRILAVGLVKS